MSSSVSQWLFFAYAVVPFGKKQDAAIANVNMMQAVAFLTIDTRLFVFPVLFLKVLFIIVLSSFDLFFCLI